MRNLKKILAMALALVMSLSLMATAGAAETTAVSGTSQYQTAAEVLQGLKVIRGDENGFRFQDSITRVEAAALVYRIATSDVEDAQRDLYTNHPFSDVPAGYWGAGYISYGYNAEIIKGNGNGTVTPDEPVTGYATMAMILRTMGYGKNGEFEGDNWEIQTAAIAKREGLLDGVTATDEARLGQAAPRELVFKILFNALLNETVDFDARFPNVYPKTGETLGYKAFKLEEIEGVVVGNEFADLNSSQVLPEGKTALQVADEDAPRTLNYTTKLTDVGESRLAYTQDTSKVLSIADTGKNKVTEYGHASDISTTAKFNATAEMPAADDIEYYVNFDRVGTYTCDQRLEFVVKFELKKDAGGTTSITYKPGSNTDTYDSLAEIIADFESRYAGGADLNGAVKDGGVGMTIVGGSESGSTVTYSKIIRANEDISDLDLAVIRGIFVAADNNNDSTTRYEGVEGDVYVGTLSNPTGASSSTYDERDLSNQISYKKFFEDYINDITYDINWNASANGQWVKFVDNDGDGKCDYAFRTHSFLDEVVGVYNNKSGDTVMQFNWFNDDDHTDRGDYTVRYMDGDEPMDRDVEVDDKVICAWIDNQYLVGHADSVTDTVTKYDWKNDIITTVDNADGYGQSGIGNATDLMELISTMDEKTEYIMYLDSFGYVRAYELPGGTNYALVTELYYTNGNNGNLVQEWPMTVELWNGEEGKDEYATSSSNPFNAHLVLKDNGPWTEVKSIAANREYYNWVQPAIAHLGVTRNPYGPTQNVPTFGTERYSFWPDFYQIAKQINGLNGSTEFDYGEYTFNDSPVLPATGKSTVTTSFTNVAIANINGDEAVLQGAATLRTDKDNNILAWNDQDGDGIYDPGTGERPRYAVDYIQLATTDVAANAVRYTIDGNDDGTYAKNNNYYVNAIHDTEYYIVYNGGVLYFKDYAKMPKLTNASNNIRAAYAVARDTSADNSGTPYWVADVIVYEVGSYNESEKSSISLAYYNIERATGNVQLLNTLNNKSENAMIDVIPKPETWGADKGSFGSYSGYGFYYLVNEELNEDGQLAASKIEAITNKFNDKGIYAGTVVRVRTLGTGGDYLDVNLTGAFEADDSTLKTEASIKLSNNIYSITSDRVQSSTNSYNEAKLLQYNESDWSEVKANDRVIWVGGSGGTGVNSAAFIVNLSHGENPATGHDNSIYYNTAAFLGWHGSVPNAGDWNPEPQNPASVNSNVAGALWKVIYDEQVDATNAKWTINYQFVDANGDPITSVTAGPDTTLKSNKTQDVTLSLTGWDVIDMQVVSVNGDTGAYSAVCKQNDAGRWILSDITADTTLKVMVVPSSSRVTVTVVTANTSPAAVLDKTVTKVMPVTGGTIDISDFLVTGYSIAASTAVTTGATGSTAFSASVAGSTLTLTNGGSVDANTTVTLTYTAGSYTLASAAAPASLTLNNISYKITPNDGSAADTGKFATANAKVNSTAAKYDGADFEITFDANPLYTYTATVTNGTPAAPAVTVVDGVGKITGKITGDCVVTIAETAKTNVATIANGGSTGGTLAVVGGASFPLSTVAGETVKVTITPTSSGTPAANTTKIEKVYYTIFGKAPVEITTGIEKAASGVWTVTLPAEAIVDGFTTTITFDALNLGAQDLTFKNNTTTGDQTDATLKYSLDDGPQISVVLGTTTFKAKPGQTITVYGDKAFSVAMSGATPTMVPGYPEGQAWSFTVPNISAAADITCSKPTT